MSIERLTQLLAPPATPLEVGHDQQKLSIEAALKTSLPSDLWAFATSYGSGMIELGGGWVQIYNLFSPGLREMAALQSDNLRALRKVEGAKRYPYKMFPAKDGLFSLGSDVNNNELYWITRGVPDEWRILVRSEDNEYEQFAGPLGMFLTDVLDKRRVPKVWSEGFLRDIGSVHFISETPKEKQPVKTIYELYVENGNTAGFWACDERDTRIKLFIKLVDGKESGGLAGSPPEYDRPTVITHYNTNGNVTKDTDLWYAYQKTFLMCDPPEGYEPRTATDSNAENRFGDKEEG